MRVYRLLQCSVSLFYLHQPKFTDLIIPLPLSIYHKNMGHNNRHAPHFLLLQRLLNLLSLPFQAILLLIQIISLFTKFFHALQLFPHSPRQSGSIFLYSPVRLRIVLLLVLICSDTHINLIRFLTSISVSYNIVSVKIFAQAKYFVYPKNTSYGMLNFSLSFAVIVIMGT